MPGCCPQVLHVESEQGTALFLGYAAPELRDILQLILHQQLLTTQTRHVHRMAIAPCCMLLCSAELGAALAGCKHAVKYCMLQSSGAGARKCQVHAVRTYQHFASNKDS